MRVRRSGRRSGRDGEESTVGETIEGDREGVQWETHRHSLVRFTMGERELVEEHNGRVSGACRDARAEQKALHLTSDHQAHGPVLIQCLCQQERGVGRHLLTRAQPIVSSWGCLQHLVAAAVIVMNGGVTIIMVA